MRNIVCDFGNLGWLKLYLVLFASVLYTGSEYTDKYTVYTQTECQSLLNPFYEQTFFPVVFSHEKIFSVGCHIQT